MHGVTAIARWKSPDDFRNWLSRRFNSLVSADLRDPNAAIDPFHITTPELSASAVSENFAAVRAWVGTWSDFAASETELELDYTDWETRNFGRVRLPRTARVSSIEGVARLLGRTRDVRAARERVRSLSRSDPRLSRLAEQWPALIAMKPEEFAILCRFLTQIGTSGMLRMRLREVPCAGMHTKFLEQNRALLVPAMAALEMPGDPEARSWAGKLGFIEDDTRQFELQDLDGGLLPYPHLALPVTQLMTCPVSEINRSALRGVVIVENQATFRALPATAGVLAIFGRGDAVRVLGKAPWLTDYPLLYAGDLDHAGFLMVANLRRDGLRKLETALMDSATALALKNYWVSDISRPGPEHAYYGLTNEEMSAQQLMATGPWRLEQERIPFDVWVEHLRIWQRTRT